ncbi:hypothetical protein [Streptomyces variabilis]
MTPTSFDGCGRRCRKNLAHTLVYGECEHAPPPEPTVSMSRVFTDTDGHPSIGFDTYTVPELARLIEGAVGDPLRAAAAAREIVHRHEPAVSSAGQAPATNPTDLRNALDGLHTLIATSSRDWGQYRVDAWIWAVLCGWDCEAATHTDTCVHGALEEQAARHGWDADTVAKARRYRAAVRAVTEAAAVLPEPAPTTNRADILRWAADHLDNSERLRDLTDDHMLDINAAANELRRLADKTATETPSMRLARQSVQAMTDTLQQACPPGCVACATDESHDPQPAAGARQDGTET